MICIECKIVQDGDAVHHTTDGDLCGICADVVYVECCECSELIKRDNVAYKYNGDALCQKCLDTKYTECADCDELLLNGNDYSGSDCDGDMVCEGCSEHYYCDELTDDTIHAADAVTAIHVNRNGQTEILTHNDNAEYIGCTYYTGDAVDELFINCGGCSEYVDREEALYTDDCAYCENCYPGSSDINFTDMGENVDGTTFDDCTSHRKYGVEIECIDASDSSYNNTTVFECKSDGSLDSGGCEFVSPILQGDNGFQELRDMCKILLSYDASVNGYCGLHIHIDLSDFDDSDLGRLFYFIQKLEPITREYVPKHRNENTYCSKSIAEKTFNATYRDGMFYDLERYSAYNFKAYNHYKTLEIRLHQGSINYNEIRNWLSLHLAIVDYVKRRENVGELCIAEIRNLLPIIARDVSTFYAGKRDRYYPEEERETRERETRERETRERETRERETRERERERRERGRRERERETRERRERETRERETREREMETWEREMETWERETRERETWERETRERETRERETRETQELVDIYYS